MTEFRFHRVGVESEELLTSIDEAISALQSDRGGLALIEQIGARDTTEFCQDLSAIGGLWGCYAGETLVAWALVQDQIILSLFVLPEFRRRGIARQFILHLLEGDVPPLDAYALPGDRAMKSLYESIGWKARLLTMRG
jgi:GNAT superfamily N-acetyltransferase